MSIDNLVVRLLGDSTQFVASMNSATTEAERMALIVDRETAKIVDSYRRAGYDVSAGTEAMVKDIQRHMADVATTYDETSAEYQEIMSALAEEAARLGKEVRQAAEEEAKIKGQGAELTKQYMTAQEKFNEQIQTYTNLLQRGAISQETFNRVESEALLTLAKTTGAYEEVTRAVEEELKLKEKGEELARKYMSAQEKFNEEMDHYSDLLVKGVIDQETFGNALEESLDKLNSSGTKIESLSEKLQGYGRTMVYVGGAIAGVFGLTIKQGVNAAAQYETTVASFKTMIGSLEETEKTMQSLTAFAVKAPMTMPQIEQAAMGLIQFGERGDAMINTLETLGNAAAGTGTHFNLLSSVFNQVRGVGHLLTGDFRQLSTRGVLSLQDIAKHFDVTEAAAGKMLSTGKVSFSAFKSILEGLSKEGGRFHNMMEDQSKTLEGQMAKMGDAMGIVVRDIGQKFMPIAKFLTDSANKILDAWSAVPEWMKTVAATIMGLSFAIGTVLAATGAWILSAASIGPLLTKITALGWVQVTMNKALALATMEVGVAMQTAWTAALGPIGLAVAAITVVVGALFYFQQQRMEKLKAETAATVAELEKVNVKEKKDVNKLVKSTQNEVDKATGGEKKSAAIDKERQKLQDEMNRIQLERNKIKEEQEKVKLEDASRWRTQSMDERAEAEKAAEIANKRLGDLTGQYSLLADKANEYTEIQDKIKKNGGVTDEQVEAQEATMTSLDEQVKKLKNIHELQKQGGLRLFDPAGLEKDFLALEKLKEDGFLPEVIAEQDEKQKDVRKSSASNELSGMMQSLLLEKEILGLTNKELLTKKYTMEGISELKVKEVADAQHNLELMKELNKLQDQNRDLGLSPHQLRKAEAEREGANAEGMALVDSISNQENETMLKGMQQEYDLMLLTNEQLAVKRALENNASPDQINALTTLQAEIKERTKLRALEDSVRSSNDNAEQEIQKMQIATAEVRVQTDLWRTQAQVRKDAQDLEFLKLQGVDSELLKQKELFDLEKNKLALIKEQIDKGASIREGLKTPQEKLKEELQRIEESLGTTLQEKAKASAQLVAGYLQNNPMVQQGPNKAITAGSTEFLKFMSDRRRERTTKNRAKTQTELLLDKQNGLTQGIIEELKNMGVLSRVR